MRSQTRVQLIRVAVVVATLVVVTVAANAILFRYTTATTVGATPAAILRTVAPTPTPVSSSPPPAAAPDPVTVAATQTSTHAPRRATARRRGAPPAIGRRQTPARTPRTAPAQPPGIPVEPTPTAQPATPVTVTRGDDRSPEGGTRDSGDHGDSGSGKNTHRDQ